MNTAAAIAEVRKFSRFIKAFEHLEAVADELSQAGQLVSERKGQLDACDAQIESRQQKLKELGLRVLEQQDEFTKLATANQVKQDALQRQAEADARAIVAEAKNELETLTEENQKAALNLRNIRQQTTKAQAKLAAIIPKLKEAQAQAKLILGGEL